MLKNDILKNPLFRHLTNAGRYVGQTARLMVGIPSYENYVQHMRLMHPDQVPMSYPEFFRERQQARYGQGKTRCC